MIRALPQPGNKAVRPTTAPVDHTPAGESALLRSIALLSLLGMLVLAPVQFIELPFNLSLVELWNLMTLPLAWLYLILSRRPLRVLYAVAMWLILIGSIVGILAAPRPSASVVAIVKDLYLYVWFLTVAALLTNLGAKNLRRFMLVWLAVEVAHGLLIIAQLVSSDVFELSAAFASQFGELDKWRPSGLFVNANSTALYQVMGFVPLLMLRLPHRFTLGLGFVLFGSVLATGSLAATVGFVLGLGVAVLVVAQRVGLEVMIHSVGRAFLILALLATVFFATVGQSSEFTDRFDSIFAQRAEGSAEGRFSLWGRGLDLLLARVPPFGIGPESYREIDLFQKPLHNDLLAFAVERGFIGLAGIITLGVTAILRAFQLFYHQTHDPQPAGLVTIVFLGVIIAALVHAQFHQIFHHRSVWLVLAMQEAVFLTALPHLSQAKSKSSVMDHRLPPRHATSA